MFEQMASGLQLSVGGNPVISFAVAFAAGFLVSLTPCVYPMLPITVGFIGGGVAGQGRARGFLLSAFYVLGLSATYSALGVASALMNKVFGFTSGSPVVMLVAGIFFIIFGLSMIEVFNLPMPGFLQNMQPKSGGGFAGAFVIGVASGLMAAPCSTPVLLAILTHIAQRGGIMYGLSLMFVYALGLGALIIVIGTWAGASKAMPKSGPWMVWIKRIFGAAIIAAGIYYAVTSAITIANNRGGQKHSPAESHESHGSVKTPAAHSAKYTVDNDTSRVDSLIGKKPVMLVFFGSWCKKCNEEAEELNKLHESLKDTDIQFFGVDINDPENKCAEFISKNDVRYPVIFDAKGAYADKFEVISAPTFIIFDRTGKRLYYGADEIKNLRPIIDKALKK